MGEPLGLGPDVIEAIRLMSETRMGVYEHAGAKGGRCLLQELITDDEFECYVPAGYPGVAGELWFVRLCPPIEPGGLPRRLHDALRPDGLRQGGLDGLPEQVADRPDGPGEAEAAARVAEIRAGAGLLERVHLQGVPPPSARRHLPDGAAGRAGEPAPCIGGHGSRTHDLSR